MRRLTSLLALLAVTACGHTAAPKTLKAYLAQTLPKGSTGTVMAARDGRLVYCKGFGTTDPAVGCDTVYDVMSITKQFTAAAILKLEMMGRLRTHDLLSRYLGPLPADKRGITLHQLLTHTAGLPESLGDDYDRVSRDDMLAKMSAVKLTSAGKFVYSNLGYSVLAAVIEKVSGLSYEHFLAKYLFRPAGMRTTGYVLPHFKPDQVATEYDNKGHSQGKPFQHPWAADGPYWNLRGNGGILSTARDMYRWSIALSGNKVLSPTAKQELFHPYARMPDTKDMYAYGWTITHDPDHGSVAMHDGGNTWSLANFAVSRHLAVFWISNHAYQKGKWNFDDLEGKLTKAIADRAT